MMQGRPTTFWAVSQDRRPMIWAYYELADLVKAVPVAEYPETTGYLGRVRLYERVRGDTVLEWRAAAYNAPRSRSDVSDVRKKFVAVLEDNAGLQTVVPQTDGRRTASPGLIIYGRS